MIRQLLLWLWRSITPLVEGWLDPDYKARLEAIKAKTADLEAKEKASLELDRQSEARLRESQARRDEIGRQIAESIAQQAFDEQAVKDAEERIKNRNAANAEANTAVDARSDDDAFSGIPKSKL